VLCLMYWDSSSPCCSASRSLSKAPSDASLVLVVKLSVLAFARFSLRAPGLAHNYCADGAADDGPPPAEDGLTDLIQAITFQRSSGDLITVPMAGIGPTTFSLPLRL